MRENIIISFTFISKSGRSIYKMEDLKKISLDNFDAYKPNTESISKISDILKREGFRIEVETEVGLSISGEIEKLEEFFKSKIIRSRIKYIRNYEFYQYTSETELSFPYPQDCIEKIFIQKQFFVLNQMTAGNRPELPYYHLNVPDDLQRIGKVKDFHKNGFLGNKVKVSLVDTGFWWHPYFQKQKYCYQTIPAINTFDIALDERGHGSGMSSVLLSIAPKVDFTMVKTSDAFVSYPLTGLQKAIMMNPDVINCSWGMIGFEPHIYLEIINAVKKGIILVYSAGNGSSDMISSICQTLTHPTIISVGGCYPGEDGIIEAADLASSYNSELFENRFCPDLCGICGMLPYGQLILFPSQPGSIFDRKNSERDGTGSDDGWFVSSGTSAAAAYVSGMIALVLNKNPQLNRMHIKEVLFKGCSNVLKGKSFMGYKADQPGWNKAVGYGFLDGEKLFKYV